jgi:hypothetical protein
MPASGEGRKAVKIAGNELEWGTPVIFSRAEDGRLLLLPKADGQPAGQLASLTAAEQTGQTVIIANVSGSENVVIGAGNTQQVHTSGAAYTPSTASNEATPTAPQIAAITGRQHGELADALVDAFGSKEELSQMVRRELDQNLDAIAGGSSLSALAFNLVDWARRSGYLRELVQGALNAKPRNQKLREFVAALRGTAQP